MLTTEVPKMFNILYLALLLDCENPVKFTLFIFITEFDIKRINPLFCRNTEFEKLQSSKLTVAGPFTSINGLVYSPSE